jgi:hypothetical protein
VRALENMDFDIVLLLFLYFSANPWVKFEGRFYTALALFFQWEKTNCSVRIKKTKNVIVCYFLVIFKGKQHT